MTTPLRSVSGRGVLVWALLGLALADATPAQAQGRGRRSGVAGTNLSAAAFVPGVGTGYVYAPPIWRNPLNENPVNPLPRTALDRIQDEIFYEDLYRRTGAYRVRGGLYLPGYGVPVQPEKVAGGYYTPGFGVLNGGLYGAPGSGPPAANVAGGMAIPGFGVVNQGRAGSGAAGGWGQGATSFTGPALSVSGPAVGMVSGPSPMGNFGSPGLAISGPAPIGSFGAPSPGFSGPTNLGGFGTPTGLAGGPAAIGGFGSPPAGAFSGPAAIGGYGQPAGISGFGAPVGGGVMQGTLVPGQGVSALVPRR